MRLIDADDLFPYGAVPYFENDGFVTADKLYGIINNAPTVDAVEVVRCEECFWWDKAKVNKKGFLICPISGMEIYNYDFCSYGERRK